jgi:hypothetical protein
MPLIPFVVWSGLWWGVLAMTLGVNEQSRANETARAEPQDLRGASQATGVDRKCSAPQYAPYGRDIAVQ